MKRFLSAVGSLLGLVVFTILVFSITANWNIQAPTSVSYGYPGPEPIKSSSQPTAYPGPGTDSSIDQKVNQVPPLPLTPILEESTEPTVDPGSSSSGSVQGEIRLVDQQEIILKGELGKIQGLYEPDSDGNTLVGKAIFEEGVAILKIDLETGAAKLLTPIISQGIEAITVSGNYVAWVEAFSTENNFHTQLIVFDLVKEEQTVLAKGLPRHPDIKDNILAWQEYRDGQWVIYSYDLAYAKQFTIAEGPDIHSFPRVCSDKWLIYLKDVQEGQPGSADLYAHNLITNEEINIGHVPFPSNAIPGRHHACDDNRVAWIGMTTATKNNEANFEQHIYDLDTRTDNILNIPIQGLSFDVSISGDILISTTGYDLSQDVLFDPFINLPTENTNGKLLFSDKRMIWIAEPYDQLWQLYTASIIRNGEE